MYIPKKYFIFKKYYSTLVFYQILAAFCTFNFDSQTAAHQKLISILLHQKVF